MLHKTYNDWFHNNVINQLGDVQYKWNDTKVDLVLLEENDEVKIQQLIDFCISMNFPHLREGSVRTLFDAGINTCESLVNCSLVDFTKLLGANGIKCYHGIQDRIDQVQLNDVMGSVPYFGRGVGKRKFKQLLAQIGEDYNSWTINDIVKADGFDEKTAIKILNGIEQFNNFKQSTPSIIYKGTTKQIGKLTGHKVCMTGFRDSNLSDRIEELGGEVTSGVSAKTTILVCTDPTSNSGKAKKAREVNNSGKGSIQIMSVDEFMKFVAK